MRKFLFVVLPWLLTISGCVSPHPVQAQFIGYTTPQTVQQVLANNVACTGSNQNFTIQNLGQTTHSLTWTNSGGTNFSIVLQGSYDATTWASFSDTANTISGLLQATGYYPIIRASVLCAAGTFTLNYGGTSTFALQPTGFASRSVYSKTFGTGLPANANKLEAITAPYGSSGSAIYFEFLSTGPAGSTLSVTAVQVAGPGVVLLNAQALATSVGIQKFLIPNIPAVELDIQFTSGGASAATYTLENDFFTPGMMPYSADPCKFSLFSNCPTLP